MPGCTSCKNLLILNTGTLKTVCFKKCIKFAAFLAEEKNYEVE